MINQSPKQLWITPGVCLYLTCRPSLFFVCHRSGLHIITGVVGLFAWWGDL